MIRRLKIYKEESISVSVIAPNAAETPPLAAQPEKESIVTNIVVHARDKKITALVDNQPVSSHVQGDRAVPILKYLIEHQGQKIRRKELIQFIDPEGERPRPDVVVLDTLRHLQKNINLKFKIILFELLKTRKDDTEFIFIKNNQMILEPEETKQEE